MEFFYTKRLGLGRNARYDPLVYVTLIGKKSVEAYCLIDSGSPHNLFSVDYAKTAGIDLSRARPVDVRDLHGKQNGRLKKVILRFLGKSWETEVVFCERGEDYNLLGGQGFFQYFDVRFRYYERKFDVAPAPALYWGK